MLDTGCWMFVVRCNSAFHNPQCADVLFIFCEFTDGVLESYAPAGVHPHPTPPLVEPALCRQGVSRVNNIGKTRPKAPEATHVTAQYAVYDRADCKAVGAEAVENRPVKPAPFCGYRV